MRKKSFDFLYWKGWTIYTILQHPPIGRIFTTKERAKMEKDLSEIETKITQIAKKKFRKHQEKHARKVLSQY